MGDFAKKKDKKEFTAQLSKYKGKKIEISNGKDADKALEKHKDAEFFVEVKFGDKSNAYLAKLIKERFLKACSNEQQKKLIQNLPLDEIQRSLPGGKGDILE